MVIRAAKADSHGLLANNWGLISLSLYLAHIRSLVSILVSARPSLCLGKIFLCRFQIVLSRIKTKYYHTQDLHATMLRYALALAVLFQSNLQMVLAANATSCAGIEYANVCCDGHIIKPLASIKKLNNLDGATCCQGDDTGMGIATTCTSGTPIPMTQLASAQANATITSAFLSVSDITTVATSTSAQSTATSTSSKGAGAVITAGPWDATLLVAGGVAAALL